MRIIILTNSHLYSNLALKEFLSKHKKDIVGVFMPDFLLPGKSFFGSVKFLLKKSFFEFCLYKWFEDKVYNFKLALGLGKLKSYSYYSKKYNFSIFKIKSINDDETINLIRKLRPDVIYSVSYPQKISEKVITIPKLGAINFHDSLLPAYRGLCAYFWITANNEKKGGVTAHYIAKEFDTGDIVLQKEYKIDKKDTMQKVYYKSSKLIGETILEVQDKLKNNKVRSYRQSENGMSSYSWPNKEGYRLFKKNKKKMFKFVELWDSI